jgi:AraC-like DNA-binding protein/mannose-6-phosphate isomerase-like protein (cupin superfamily)
MMSEFSTDHLPIAERLPAYERAMADYFSSVQASLDLQIDAGPAEAFAASISTFSIGRLQGGAHRNSAPHSLVAATTGGVEDVLDLYLVFDGRISFSTDAAEVTLGSGDMALLPAEATFRARADGIDMVALSVPGALIRQRAAGRAAMIGRTIRGGSGLASCLSAMLRAAAQRGHVFSAGEGALLQSTVLDALLHLATACDEELDEGLSPLQLERLDSLRSIALDAIADPDLGPCLVARRGGVSTRTLHRLFQASGKSFAGWLRERRLERCWSELSRPSARRPNIAALAFKWGFNDLTTFNRAFRERYGVTPREIRPIA